jgi:hypothetical protein
MYQVVTFYGLFRVPIYMLANRINGDDNIMDSKFFIFTEVLGLLIFGGLRSAGCFIRFMNEEIITQT